MCYPKECHNCGKTTWGGCGLHVDTVMRNIPEPQRCHCHDNPNNTTKDTSEKRGLFSWLKRT